MSDTNLHKACVYVNRVTIILFILYTYQYFTLCPVAYLLFNKHS